MTQITHTKRVSPKKDGRIDIRIPVEKKDTIEFAANIEGRSLADFVSTSAYHAAELAIRAHRVLSLTARDSQRFISAVLNSQEPTDRQRDAAAQYAQEFLE